MAYQINKTDGTIVSTVADGQVDTLSTDLTLIGKNYSGFGESLNENFVKLLENFANSVRPSHPIRGQVWFDTAEARLKVYNGTEFVPVSSAQISGTQPTTLGTGDLWFNSTDKQLYFYDGTNAILLGPDYSDSQGKSGFEVRSILDTLNQTRVITLLYNNGILLGIFAKDTFTPKVAIAGFSGAIQPGFNSGTIEGFKFNTTATNAEQLGGADATTYVRKDTSNIISGQVRITTDLGIVVGSGGQANLTVSGGDVILSNSSTNKDIVLNVRKGIVQEDAIRVVADTRKINLYDGYTDSEVVVGGDLTVTGDLTVQGDTITLNAATLQVEDKSIFLAKVEGESPTDVLVDGGGVFMQGDDMHALIWSDLGALATTDSPDAVLGGYHDRLPKLLSKAWNSTDSFNLASGKYFAIDGIPVLSGNSLGLGITSIPGVTSFGTLSILNVGPSSVDTIRIEDNVISTVNVSLPDLEIDTLGDVVLNGSSQVKGVATPTDSQDATNKDYVDSTVRTRALAFSLVIPLDSVGTPTITNSYIAQYILPNLAPVAEYDANTVARIFCSFVSNSTASFTPSFTTTSNTFDLAGGSGTAAALTSISIPAQTVPEQVITPTQREIRVFRIIGSAWTPQPASTISLP